MCFVLVAFRTHHEYPLVVAANRDEYYQRAATAARWWETEPPILAGRDEEAGGAWFGVRGDGRFGIVTNRRAPSTPRDGIRSRGELIPWLLSHSGILPAFHRHLDEAAAQFNAYNLLYGDLSSLYFYDNHRQRHEALEPGIYALSNAFLDTPWPKVEAGRRRFAQLVSAPRLDQQALFGLLRDDRVYPAESLPDTGIGTARERALSAIFIDDGDYGTRCSTVLTVDARGRVRFEERSHAGARRGDDVAAYAFELDSVAAGGE